MRRRRLLLMILVPLGVLLALVLILDRRAPTARVPHVSEEIRINRGDALNVRGVLVHADTGAPLAGADVETYRVRAYADEAVRAFGRREAKEARQDGQPHSIQVSPYWLVAQQSSGARGCTGEDGVFDVFIHNLPISAAAKGPKLRAVRLSEVVAALVVHVEGRLPVVVEVPGRGVVRDRTHSNASWATWDLGRIEVPAGD